MVHERPKWNDKMLNELAVFTADIIAKWSDDDSDIQDLIEDCESILRYHKDDDGYELAKQFEDLGYESDRALVEELDIVSYECLDILKRHIKKWVAENNLTLDFKIGDNVKFDDRTGVKNGIIRDLRPETMQYVIWHEKLDKNTIGTYIVAEKVELL